MIDLCFCLNMDYWIPLLIIDYLGTFLHSKCSSCCLSKSHVLPFPVSYSQATAPFHIIHSDVWGIAQK